MATELSHRRKAIKRIGRHGFTKVTQDLYMENLDFKFSLSTILKLLERPWKN